MQKQTHVNHLYHKNGYRESFQTTVYTKNLWRGYQPFVFGRRNLSDEKKITLLAVLNQKISQPKWNVALIININVMEGNICRY